MELHSALRGAVAQTASKILRDRFLKPGGKLADTLLTPSRHTGKTCDRNLIVSVQNSRRDRYGKILSWRDDYGNNFEDCV